MCRVPACSLWVAVRKGNFDKFHKFWWILQLISVKSQEAQNTNPAAPLFLPAALRVLLSDTATHAGRRPEPAQPAILREPSPLPGTLLSLHRPGSLLFQGQTSGAEPPWASVFSSCEAVTGTPQNAVHTPQNAVRTPPPSAPASSFLIYGHCLLVHCPHHNAGSLQAASVPFSFPSLQWPAFMYKVLNNS